MAGINPAVVRRALDGNPNNDMRKFSRPGHMVGHAPGTVSPSPKGEQRPVSVKRITFDAATFDEHDFGRVEDCLVPDSSDRCTWIDIDSVHDPAIIELLGKQYDLHPLLLEDIVNPVQRAKVERYGGKTYIVVRTLSFDREREQIQTEQISMVLFGNTLITIKEKANDIFDPVRERLRSGSPRMRSSGAAYLTYALIDAVVDRYFVLLEEVGEHMEELEEALLQEPDQDTLNAIHRLRRELIYLRKTVWPLREAIGALMRDESHPVDDQMHFYLRDLYDHSVQVIETVESYRDLNAGMLETYLSVVSNRMNEIMKTLTVIATIFIPLTFIAGIYGMNFDYMPELHWRWSYPVSWLVMVVVVAFMLRYFKRNGWF